MTGFNLYQVLLKASTIDVESEIAPEHEEEFFRAYNDLTRTLKSKELDQIIADPSSKQDPEEGANFGEMIESLVQKTPEEAGGRTQLEDDITTDLELRKQLQEVTVSNSMAKKVARLRSLLQNPSVRVPN